MVYHLIKVCLMAVVILVIACVAMFLLSIPGGTHSFYDLDCCAVYDCAPVEKAEYVQMNGVSALLPTLVLHTKHGKAPVLPATRRLRSPNSQSHACIGHQGTQEYGFLRCWYQNDSQ